MLDILRRIKMFLLDDEITLARELVELELDNITGATEERCKNTKYYANEWYCKDCSNLNCSSNMSE